MKAFIAAVAALVVLGGLAAVVLSFSQRPAYQAYATTGARVGDPGENLVGGSWTGNPGRDPARGHDGNG